MKSEQFKGAIPAQFQGRVVWLDGEIPVHQLRAALKCTGLVLKATRGVIRITLPARVKQ